MATQVVSQGLSTVPEPKWRQTLSNALIITRREVRDSFRDWRIITPIIILTFGFPFVAQFLAGKFLGFVSDYGAQIVGERTIPFLLMILIPPVVLGLGIVQAVELPRTEFQIKRVLIGHRQKD